MDRDRSTRAIDAGIVLRGHMAQRKQHEVDGWLARPDPAIAVVLIHGPDRGLVAERAARFAVSQDLALDDPFAVVRFDAADVERDPGRLHDEAATVPLFGGRRLIWVRNVGAQKTLAEAAKTLVSSPPRDTTVLFEAGDLKKGAPLRAVIEASPSAMALPCYADEGRSIDELIDALLSPAGKTLSVEARHVLRAQLGGDRLASRGEIEKLILYCGDRQRVEPDDVLAATGDASAISADAVIDELLRGRVAQMDERMRRFLASGAAPFLLLSAAMRQFQALSSYRRRMDAEGLTSSSIVAGARPPVFFARRPILEKALDHWTETAIAQGLDRLQRAVLATRRHPMLAEQILAQALLGLGLAAAKPPNRPSK